MSNTFISSDHSRDRLSLLDRWREIETPAMWFILMNVLDAALIYILLNTPGREGGPVGVESNQIALYFLNRWGIKGMFSFKLASALFVCAIAYVVTFKNVETARRLLTFGTVIVMVVVVYSVLVTRHILHGVNLWPLG